VLCPCLVLQVLAQHRRRHCPGKRPGPAQSRQSSESPSQGRRLQVRDWSGIATTTAYVLLGLCQSGTARPKPRGKNTEASVVSG